MFKTSFSKYGRAYIDTVIPTFVSEENKVKETYINA